MGQSENTAPAADRILIRSTLNGPGDSFSLQNVNTAPLPDGCLAWAIDVQALYALNKESTLPPQADEVVAPASGPGNWERVVSSAVRGGSVSLVTTSSNTYGFDGNFGIATSSFFSLDQGSSDHPDWALTALGGVLTYTGPTRPFVAMLSSELEVGNSSAPRIVTGGISHNNDLTGAAASGINALSATLQNSGDPYPLSIGRRVIMASGDTLSVKYGTSSAAAALTARLTLEVVPA